MAMKLKAKTAVKKAPVKKPAGQIVAAKRNVDGAALKKAIAKREQPATEEPKVIKIDKYLVGVVRGARFGINNDGVTRRLVTEEPVYADRDLANEPEEKNRLISAKMAEMSEKNKGIRFNDLDAIRSARDGVEESLDTVRHDLRYGNTCPECAAEQLGRLIEALHEIGRFEDRLEEVIGTCTASTVPNVLPASQDMEIQGDRLVYKKTYPVQIHTVMGQGQPTLEQLPENIREIVKGFIGDPAQAALPPPAKPALPQKK